MSLYHLKIQDMVIFKVAQSWWQGIMMDINLHNFVHQWKTICQQSFDCIFSDSITVGTAHTW